MQKNGLFEHIFAHIIAVNLVKSRRFVPDQHGSALAASDMERWLKRKDNKQIWDQIRGGVGVLGSCGVEAEVYRWAEVITWTVSRGRS